MNFFYNLGSHNTTKYSSFLFMQASLALTKSKKASVIVKLSLLVTKFLLLLHTIAFQCRWCTTNMLGHLCFPNDLAIEHNRIDTQEYINQTQTNGCKIKLVHRKK